MDNYLFFIVYRINTVSTTLIGEYGNHQISVIIYGINIIIVLSWAYLQWKYATKEHRLVDGNLQSQIHNNHVKKNDFGVNFISYSDCCFTSKYSSKSCIVYLDSHILSHSSKVFFDPCY